MTKREHLFNLFLKNTGTSVHTPKRYSTVQVWQESRIKEYAFEESS